MISIITPTYNRLASLRKSIKSVISQQSSNIELIIIDDCSTDATQEFLEKLRESYPFVKVIVNSVNKGVNYSRNRGIEIATKEFILFLDSDDKLVEGCLVKILSSIKANEDCQHFLFPVSYRINEFKRNEPKEMKYEDWLRNSITGDFTHVVSTKVMKKYLFFEEFRAYEYLNWFRIKKETSPQLLIPFDVVSVDRCRNDSLTTASKLSSASVIKSKFESLQMYYHLYYNDLVIYSPKSLKFKLIETVILGTACNQKNDCRTLLKYAFNFKLRVFGVLITFLPSFLVRQGIIKFSALKK